MSLDGQLHTESLTVTGTALGHDWAEATCTTPKTCRRCHVSEGEALDHDWLEATCTAPVTCARCGQTVGEPLGHRPTEADYWSPGVCTVCGQLIRKPRLVNQPFVQTCMECQNEMERNSKG